MTTRAMNWYIGARTGLSRGGSVQVCLERDEAAAEVRAALEADGVPVRVEDGVLMAGEGPCASDEPEPEPEPVLTPAEQRAAEYEARGVDKLAVLFASYTAEGQTAKAAAVAAQIMALKAAVREAIPDEPAGGGATA